MASPWGRIPIESLDTLERLPSQRRTEAAELRAWFLDIFTRAGDPDAGDAGDVRDSGEH